MEIEAITATEPLRESVSSQLPTAPERGPGAIDAEMFARMLAEEPQAAPAPPVTTVTAAPSGGPVAEGAAPEVNRPWGEVVLTGLGNIGREMQQTVTAIRAQVGASPANQPISISELLKLQTDMFSVTVRYDLIGKAVGKSGQNIDQLVRMQ